MIKVGDVVRLRAFYVTSKVGTAGLTVTVDYTDESGNATTGASASAGAIAGEYYYSLTPDAPGMWCFCFKTATATVDQQHLPGVIEVEADYTTARAALLANCDAAVSTVKADTGAILTAVDTEVASILAAVDTEVGAIKAKTDLIPAGGIPSAADIWAYAAGAGRTLTSFGSLVADLAAAVWAYTSRVLTTAIPATVVSPVTADGDLTLYVGDAYTTTHARQLPIPIPYAPDLTLAVLAFLVDGITFSPVVTPTVVGALTSRVARVQLTAAQCALLTAASYPYQVQATWAADTPPEPAVIASGHISTKRRLP